MDIFCHPITKEKVEKIDELFYANGNVVAKYHNDINRVDWISYINFETINKRLMKEISKFDKWASEQILGPINSEIVDITEYDLYSKNKNFKNLSISLDELITNARILDIGGSCIDSSRFLKFGAKEIHQVEVSAMSQRLGYQRTVNRVKGNEKKKLTFHTCPAEYLPFSEGTFDLIFSRSSIHHTQREKSIPEIARVLKPSGEVLFFEPVVKKIVLKGIVLLRKLRKVDRGTDLPLYSKDLKILENYFKKVSVKPKLVFLENLKLAFSWTTNLIPPPPVSVIYAAKK